MSSNFICGALLIIVFLESGKSNSDVFISHHGDGDIQNITCVLSGDENMTQINWVMLQGPNHTKLGKLEQCKDISKRDASANTSKKDFTYVEREQTLGLFGRLGAIIIGTILSLFVLTIIFYLCKKNNCRRRKSFEIQMYQTDSPAETHAEQSVDTATPLSSPNGFDPSKLYAKIKKDLFYGRLWKSYQGQPKAWTQGTVTDQGHVYHLLGQSPLPQRNVEDRHLRPDTTEGNIE